MKPNTVSGLNSRPGHDSFRVLGQTPSMPSASEGGHLQAKKQLKKGARSVSCFRRHWNSTRMLSKASSGQGVLAEHQAPRPYAKKTEHEYADRRMKILILETMRGLV